MCIRYHIKNTCTNARAHKQTFACRKSTYSRKHAREEGRHINITIIDDQKTKYAKPLTCRKLDDVFHMTSGKTPAKTTVRRPPSTDSSCSHRNWRRRLQIGCRRRWRYLTSQTPTGVDPSRSLRHFRLNALIG